MNPNKTRSFMNGLDLKKNEKEKQITMYMKIPIHQNFRKHSSLKRGDIQFRVTSFLIKNNMSCLYSTNVIQD